MQGLFDELRVSKMELELLDNWLNKQGGRKTSRVRERDRAQRFKNCCSALH